MLGGLLVQEAYASHPALRVAAGPDIQVHAVTPIPMINAARKLYAPQLRMDASRRTDGPQQGGVVLAQAMSDPEPVFDAVMYLRQYVEHLFPIPTRRRR